MYYILKFDVLTNAYMARSVEINNQNIINNKFEGIRFNLEGVRIELPATQGIITDYISNIYGLLILSEKIKNLFVEYDRNYIEYCSVNLKRKSETSFFCINILDNIDCIDYEKSELTELIPGIKVFKRINKLVLDSSKINNRNFFRIEDFPTEIIISEEFKKKLEEYKFEVIRFIPLDSFTFELGNPQ